jgi:hypothetical protein
MVGDAGSLRFGGAQAQRRDRNYGPPGGRVDDEPRQRRIAAAEGY